MTKSSNLVTMIIAGLFASSAEASIEDSKSLGIDFTNAAEARIKAACVSRFRTN